MRLNSKARATKAKASPATVAEMLPPPPAEIILPASATTAAPAAPEPVAPLTTTAPAVVADAPAIAADAPAPLIYKSATRDAQTVIAQATAFALESNRDSSYLIFFGSVMRAPGNNDSATLAQIHAAGKPDATGNRRTNPHYTGSAKATDGGAINRAIKAGYFIASESGNRLTATEKAKANALYNKIPLAV